MYAGYLQHGRGAGPFRTERVNVRLWFGGKWQAFFEGKWRTVWPQTNRLYVNCRGERITIKIEED